MTLAANEHLIATDRDQLYISDSKGTITAKGPKGKSVIARGVTDAKCLLKMNDDNIFVTQQKAVDGASILWLIKSGGTKRIINTQRSGGNYIAVYPNHKLLMQTEGHSQWIYSYVIDDKDLVRDGQRFYWLHNTENMSFDEYGKMTFDANGNMYVPSKMGIQVCDQNGRVRAILTFPSGRISSIVFGGKNRDILYVLSGGKLFRRKLNTRGVESWMSPVEPGSQGAG
jgi:sugar lactone lactonase YvrE